MSTSKIVKFHHGTGEISAFLVLPRDPVRHRAIIVIHEWWGLTPWVKRRASNLARNGYVVLAMDLYHGKVASLPAQARKLKHDLSPDLAICEMKAAFEYLAGRADVDRKHIGVLGWSLGGGMALQLAIHEQRLAACVVHYGALPTKLADIKKIRARMLGIFAARDREISPNKVHDFEKRINVVKNLCEIKIYNDVGHAFENPANTRSYRPKVAADAWRRTLLFFDRTL